MQALVQVPFLNLVTAKIYLSTVLQVCPVCPVSSPPSPPPPTYSRLSLFDCFYIYPCTVVNFYGTTRQFLLSFSVNLKKGYIIVCIRDNRVKISLPESGFCESDIGFKVGRWSFCPHGFLKPCSL